jgi:transposase
MKKAKITVETSASIVNVDAAGIDVGAREMWVCVPVGRAEPRVRPFGTFTPDLQQLADWLVTCGITTVAMESTGVYTPPPMLPK